MKAPPGYRILARLAAGGMAEVLLAQRVGAEGIAKTVVLKCVRPDLAGDPEIVRTLLEEARLSVELSHANIPAVFELGRDGDTHFLAMEYVRGWDLARVLGACQKAGRPFPVGVALDVAAEIAKALAYAHERRGPNGEPRGIVHRDVSPPNVLLSVDGEVKLADFGIARAAARAAPTNPGWIKGKLPYMSPEQARGAPVDARSDLFSLGVVLFEMLTARRLFRAESDAALIAAVSAAVVPPPSAFNPSVPAPVDALVARALARDPAHRFESARALHAALRSLAPSVGAESLVPFLASLGLPPPLDPTTLAAAKETPAGALDPAPAARHFPRAAAAGGPADVRRRVALVVAAAAVVGFAVGSVARLAASRMARIEVRSPTPDVKVRIDGVERGTAPLVVELPAGRVRIELEREGYAPLSREIDLRETPDVVVDAALDPLR